MASDGRDEVRLICEVENSGGDNMLYALVDYSNNKNKNRILSEEVLGEVKVVIPKFKEKKNQKYANKLIKTINSYNVQNVVLSKSLSENIEFCKLIEENKKYIITGRRLSKVLLMTLVEEISRYTKYKKEKMNIVLLMNEYSLENIDLIELISKEIKQLNVISRNYTKYEKTSDKLFNEYGYVVKLFDEECEKEFSRANIVINLDFKEEAIQKININRNCVVISLNEKINSLKRGFNGIIVNDLDILGYENNDFKYRGLALCEAKIYKPLRKLKDNERIFNGEKYVINGYMGKRGKITEEEFEKIGKTFT